MISKLSHKERSALFANLSSIAYLDEKEAKKAVKVLGFTQVEFYNKDGAQAYRFQNKDDMVIACRGTQPTEFNDIKADLRAIPVLSETVSRVHKGFKAEVDELWPMILEDLNPKVVGKRKVWVTGHSLGAAMATIVAARCTLDKEKIPDVQVEELYTYGSPRVGWNKYCKSLPVTHYRWRNNNDIVTTVPPAFMGYNHHGNSCYINAYGKVRNLTGWQLTKDKLRGMWMGIKSGRIDNFSDHSIGEYIKHLENWCQEEE
jgi:triacylglycerol lipase